MLKEIIDKLTSIYNEYGDLDVIKNDECGGYFGITPEKINVVDFFDKECRSEMEKHKPFGWVKEKESGFYHNFLSLTSLGCFLHFEEDPESFEDLYKMMTFYDGKPFGEEIK